MGFLNIKIGPLVKKLWPCKVRLSGLEEEKSCFFFRPIVFKTSNLTLYHKLFPSALAQILPRSSLGTNALNSETFFALVMIKKTKREVKISPFFRTEKWSILRSIGFSNFH